MLNAAPEDGSYTAMINSGSIAMPGLRKDVGFETLKMDWLWAPCPAGPMGSASIPDHAMVAALPQRALPRSLAHDQDGNEAYCDHWTSGKASTSYLIPSFINKTLGTKFRIIFGYKNGRTMNLAMQKGEVEGRGDFLYRLSRCLTGGNS